MVKIKSYLKKSHVVWCPYMPISDIKDLSQPKYQELKY